MENKWFYLVWILGGLLCLGSALNYFIGGEYYHSTSLRTGLVIAQIFLAVTVVFYGLRFYRRKSFNQ